jgi:hypothetical protein
MATKQIIILGVNPGPGGTLAVNCAYWFPVTVGQQVPTPNLSSAFRGASIAELSSLQNGLTVEQTITLTFPVGTPTASIQTALQTSYAAALAAFQAQPAPNQFYGAFFDGTIWNAAAPLPPAKITGLHFGEAVDSAAGDTVLIPGVAGQSIAVDQFRISAAGAVTVLIKDGAGITLDAYVFAGAGSAPPLPNSGVPWYLTTPGNGLVLNLSAAVQVIVDGWFSQA